MPMDIVDQELAEAERDASPGLYRSRASNEIESVVSLASTASSSLSARGPNGSQVFRRNTGHSTLEHHPTELSRIQTQRSQHTATVGSRIGSRSSSRKPLPAFGAGKPYPPPLPNREEYVVEFDGPNDPLHAQNWPLRKKVLTAAMLGYTTMTSAFTSSIFSSSTAVVAQQYGVGSEVGLLGTTFYVLGFAFGPTLWAPLSELRGRRLPLVVAMFGFSLFSIACATAKDIQTILLCRFFSGFFGACPLAVVAAVFSDMFDNATRGIAVTLFSMAVFTGPLLAPFIGGFIVESHLGWRWTEYLPSIMGFAAFILDFFFLNETYPPVLLVSKASELRRRTKNWGIHAKQEEIEVDFGELITKNFSRPMRLLFTEPIILLLSIYMSFIYGLLYLFLTAYPIVFVGVHGFSLGKSGLTFFGMICGQLLAGASVIAQQPWYMRKLAGNNGVPIPEWRLPNVMAGGVSFTIGIFWFGWTGYRADIHWAVPAASGIFTGFGLMSIFLQALNYLVDAYLVFAASAIAGNTFLRSLAGAGFPLFARQMFEGMGIQWAATLLGCVAAVLAPIPFIFYKYGGKIRERSAYAPTKPMSPPVGAEEEQKKGEGAPTEKQSQDVAAMANAPKKESDQAGPIQNV
ncbi:major facilitator superfamily protein [Hirsutella rhossiliensis]|uniref:Major facilitator superfamily domain-containing protein n=1 Tax=Hirsutella rhossiliensis TaxID=111463 RepID=A0A9P8N823_9HYPO|nr:major facilitator superfamily domain-containing protein [Hirsutella rhossiliensis]KAH0968257.1 major facilitator superfamily domain-containing protein [Hirsutella rhossiliensis]